MRQISELKRLLRPEVKLSILDDLYVMIEYGDIDITILHYGGFYRHGGVEAPISNLISYLKEKYPLMFA